MKFYFLITDVMINRLLIGVIFLILLALLYVLKHAKKFLKLKSSTENEYLNMFAKVKSIEFAPNAIITITIDGKIVAWNRGGETIFGWKEEDMLGKGLTDIIPPRLREAHIKGIERVKSLNSSPLFGKTIELIGLKRNGEEFPISLTLWQWKDGVNKFYTGIISDISISKKKDVEYETMLDIFKKGEEIDDYGIWNWDVITDVVTFSPGFKKIFDIEWNISTAAVLMKRIYYEDRKTVEDAIKTAFILKKGYFLKYKIVASDGHTTLISNNAKTFLDNKGSLTNIIGVVRVIKEEV